MQRAFVSIAAIVTLTFSALAQSTAFTYQGRLSNAGAPADGQHDLRFRLFDAASGGTQVGSTLCLDGIDVVEGLFTAQLDFGQQYATPAQRYLEIQVRADIGQPCIDDFGYVLLAPRQRLTATPLASHAKSAFSLDAPDGSPASAVFVDNAGSVGIGTLAPVAKLHVLGGDLLAGPSGEEWIFHTRAHAGGDFLHITDSDNGVLQFQRGLTLNESGNVGIGTLALSSKLEVRGNIRLGSAGQFLAAAGEENLRIVRGTVDATGAILEGSGFAVVRTGTGGYDITFNTPFADKPTVTATVDYLSYPQSGEAVAMGAGGGTTSTQRIVIRFDNFTPLDSDFRFIAIGPR